MKTFFLYLFLLGGILPVCAGTGAVHSNSAEKRPIIITDTIPAQKQDVPVEKKEPPGRQNVAKGKPIKEVPRAKNQAKPKMVVAPRVKIKPVKIIKPKINGKGLGR
ncbi:hypothetical protein [Niabella aurantiaca]|uniref:hypothetical protein n=1 Tax=Niabella aurantiaca TaxID=379900 RepID=UPI000371FC9D|nr:hypothetical protein [Niabella aurantiaca]